MRSHFLIRNLIFAIFALSFLSSSVDARRLKLYGWPKTIAPGQLGILYFENPNPEAPKAQSKCVAERLIAWVKSDIPILRIEQKGKQVWTSLGSYTGMGDTSMASFMAPVTLEPGPATIFVVNDRDASIPYAFTVVTKIEAKISALAGAGVQPLKKFTLVGEGFLPSQVLDISETIRELDDNVGYSKMPAPEQWQTLNRRVTSDWDRLPYGNFLFIKQGEKEWKIFVEQCGITKSGLTLDFSAPPDLMPGQATLTLALRQDHKEVARTAPFTVAIQ